MLSYMIISSLSHPPHVSKVDMPNSITSLNRTHILSSMWLGVDPTTYTKETCL